MATKNKKTRKKKIRVKKLFIPDEIRDLIKSLEDENLPVDERKELQNRLYDHEGNLHQHLYKFYYVNEFRKK